MLIENRAGHFHQVNTQGTVFGEKVSSTCSWWDFDRDGMLDLYVGHGDFSGAAGRANSVYRNLGNGEFTEATKSLGLHVPLYESGSPFVAGSVGAVGTSDINDDGWPDIYLPVYMGRNRLLLSDGSGSFVDATSSEVGDAGEAIGMSLADFDSDGDIDLFQPSGGDVSGSGIRSRSRM